MRVIGLALAAALMATPASAQTSSGARGPEIPIRVWSGEGSANIRLEMPEAIGHEARLDGDRLTLRFAEPVRADVVSVMKGLPDLVRWAEAGADGRTFTFRMKRPVTLRETDGGGVLLLSLTPQTEASPSIDATTVRVRTGVHPGYSRIVFDWPSSVDYQAQDTAEGLRLAFSAPAAFDMSEAGRAAQAIRPQAAGVAGGSAVLVAVPEGGEARHFRLGNRIVVDLYRRSGAPAETATAAERPEPPRPQTAEARTQPPLPTARPESAPPPKPAQSVASAAPSVPPQSATPAAVPPPPPAPPAPTPPVRQPPPAAAPDVAPKQEPPEARPVAKPVVTPQPQPEAPKQVPAPKQAEQRPQAKPATPPAPAPTPAQVPAPATVQKERPTGPQIQVSRGESRVTMAFPGTSGARAVVFRRAGQIWVAFDRPLSLSADAVRSEAPDLVPMIEQLPRKDVALFRIAPSPGLEPTVDRDAAGWSLTLTPQASGPERAFDVRAEAATPAGGRIVIPVDSPGPVIEAVDPDAGDRLLMVPVGPLHLGIAEQRNYPEFALLPAPQGIAISARTERLRVSSGPNAVEIGTSRGLLLNSASATEKTEPAAPAVERRTEVPTGPALLQLRRWARSEEPFTEVRSELQRAVAAAPQYERNPARLELARFLLGRGFAAEALGVLRLVSDDAPAIATRPQFLGMRAAAQLLSDHDAEAKEDLSDPSLASEAEAAVWRGLLLAREKRWSEAAQRLRAGQHFVEGYPDWIRDKFALAAVEAALETGDSRMAEAWLSMLGDHKVEEPTKSRIEYLRARLLLADGSLEAGRAALDRAAAGDDRLTRARAGLARVELGLADGSMSHEQAIDELERLRFVWRGDDLEYDVLARLGQAYLDGGRYWDGLTVLRDALSTFPEGERTTTLTQQMTNAFRSIFAEGKTDELSPLKAMALYEEFRELTPAGSDGDAILRSLAGRLVALDLFEPAASILDDLVRNRLSGAPRAPAVADLALVQILDGKADAAIKTLDLAGADEPGATSRRRHLRARALAELGRSGEAIRVLAGDNSREATLLTADLNWRAADWGRAATAYRQLLTDVDQKQPLSEDDARIVLRLAVAETLAGNAASAKRLASQYGNAMASTQQGAAFRLVVSGSEPQPGIDRIAAALAGADEFKSQLKAYRDALEKPEAGSDSS